MRYIVTKGEEAGITLTPHRHKDGAYVVSPSRFECDYIRVESLHELTALAQQGYSIRMSSPQSKLHRAPSLISSESLELRRPTHNPT